MLRTHVSESPDFGKTIALFRARAPVTVLFWQAPKSIMITSVVRKCKAAKRGPKQKSCYACDAYAKRREPQDVHMHCRDKGEKKGLP